MSWGLLHSIATVAAMLAFFAIAWWAYSPKNKARFDEAAKLALDEEVTIADTKEAAAKNSVK